MRSHLELEEDGLKHSHRLRARFRHWIALAAGALLLGATLSMTASLAMAEETLAASIGPVSAKTATMGNAATPGSVAVGVAPAMVTIAGSQTVQFSATVSGTSNTAVNWSVSPLQGTISPTGAYTAPVWTVPAGTPSFGYWAQMVQVTATSQADPTISASATVVITPTVAASQGVWVSVSPAVVTLSAGQSQQLTASVTGSTNTAVTWSMSPAVGTLSNGLYTAPANISGTQTVTVTATSSADPTKSASSSISLASSVGIAITPGSVTLGPGQSNQFNVSISGTTNTGVTWSLSPVVGTITNGVYTAPATITTLQTIMLTVASMADPTKTAQSAITLTPPAPVTISVSPNQATLLASQTQQFTASIQGTTNTAVSWSIFPTTSGTITSGGLYTAPSSVTSSQTVWVTATSAADSTKSATSVVTLSPNISIQLPVEVIGFDGKTTTTSFNIPAGSNLSGAKLWLKIHGLQYETQASMQLNGGAWTPINTSTVTLLGLANTYGGIGGGFHTLQMTMPLAAAAVTTGTNTISFRFNGTDGRVSGFRVLGFNIQDAGGKALIPASSFVWDDPNTWQPPSSLASDIAAGKTLWLTAPLTVPSSTGASPIQAHCTDCHAQDGRDMKYFNYSNNSIRSRSMFHGLTAQQGDQIASYIRSLSVPNPGRPWNPPYQPGPGLDSQPVANWAAGAGLDAVLDSDAAMLPYLAPGGSTAGWGAHQYLNPRELPIAMQLPDWNSWLPGVHPLDAYGATFSGSAMNTLYPQIRSILKPGSTTAYASSLVTISQWGNSIGTFLAPYEAPTTWTVASRQAVYSAAQWQMVKLWELNQEFGLESMPQVPFGAKANVRGWYTNRPFFVSPVQLHIGVGPGLGNGSAITFEYLSYIWYHIQMLFNDGQGSQYDHDPVDYGYVNGRLKDLSVQAGVVPEINLQLFWVIKALQEFTLIGKGPEFGTGAFHPTSIQPHVLVQFDFEWGATPPSTRSSLSQAYLQAWFAQVSSYTPSQYYQGADGNGRPWASPTENPALDDLTVLGGQIWYMLPRFRYVGVDPNLTYQISAWAATVFPAGNWARNNAASCTSVNTCTY